MGLIAAILRYVEEKGNGVELEQPKFADYTEAQVNYHVALCKQAGYLLLYLYLQPQEATIGRKDPAGLFNVALYL